jgi:hypothetical protein
MSSLLKEMLEWSEVWALFIPLTILFVYKNKNPYLKPVRIYLAIALVLNLLADVLWKFRSELRLEEEDFLWNNNFIYNIGSCVRLFLFAWFFIGLRQHFMNRLKAIIPFAFFVFLLVNFIFFENFLPRGKYGTFSSRLLATESALLLFYCLQYFIYLILEEKQVKLKNKPGFFVVMGLSVYMAGNFFIFLFWEYLARKMTQFALGIWDVHNITFIIFCIILAIQFRQEDKKLSLK